MAVSKDGTIYLNMSVNNIDGNISQVRAESNWRQNRKADNSGKRGSCGKDFNFAGGHEKLPEKTP